uniref:CUB domain-containing protein n=1 Tax=Rhabditophanes sp. KR3021 TaxID=114890 RepID=A0AC35TMQ2_9BILA
MQKFALTTVVPTTTYEPYSGGCSHAASNVLTVDASGFSVIYTSSTTQMTGWTISEKNVWKNFCVKFTLEVINDNTAFPTAALKITEIISRINAYVVYYATRKTKVYSIKIGIWGSIEQLCGC